MNNESVMIEKFVDCWMKDNDEVDGQRTYSVAKLGDRLREQGVATEIVIHASNIACRLIMEVEFIESDGKNA